MIAFKLDIKVLILDMPVRWNSTYDMLALAIKQRPAINAVCVTQQLDISVKDIYLTEIDWAQIQEIASFFKMFVSTTKKMQSTSSPTLNEVIPRYHLLIKNVSDRLRDTLDSSPLRQACLIAIKKLRGYYIGAAINHSYAGVATVCDPRFKLVVFDKLLPPESLISFKALIEKQFIACCIKYKRRQRDIEVQDLELQLAAEEEVLESNNIDELGSDDDLFFTESTSVQEHEWSRYLAQPVAPQVTNIYDYWKVKQYEFPTIAKIARDFLAIPATSAPSECVFSGGSDLISKKRARLSVDSIQMLMCLRDWGAIPEDDAEEELILD